MHHHPDVHTPWQKWSEDQTLHVIVPYMNAFRWESRRRLANETIIHLASLPNVAVHSIEITFADRPPELTAHGERCHQCLTLNTNDSLWVKENAINLAVSRLPAGWKYAAYVDADFHFTRHDWALETIHLLQHHDFVQPFSTYADVTGNTPSSWNGSRPYRLNSSFAWNFLHPTEFLQNAMMRNGQDSSYFKTKARSETFPFGYWPGAPGGAWAWRRPAFQSVGGLLDTCILGSGDYHMAVGLAGLPDAHREMHLGLAGYQRAIEEWQKRAAKLHGNIGCVDGFAIHKWHGNKQNRGYGDRPAILKEHSFDPYADIKRDWQGLWTWAGSKFALRDATRRFFLSRNEDEVALRDAKGPLV